MPNGLLDNWQIAKQLWKGFGNNPRNQETVDAMKGMVGLLPLGAGDAASGLLAADDVRRGDYTSAALNGVGLLPVVPSMAGILKRADLKPGGPEFGQWSLSHVERRLRPEAYIDSLGNDRVKYVADMDNAEQSWGSGQPVANIYWMKDKRTGDIKPFGDDTAHYAMGKDSSAYAKKVFAKKIEEQNNAWFKQVKSDLGYKWHENPGDIEKVREWLIKGEISQERALELIKKRTGKDVPQDQLIVRGLLD